MTTLADHWNELASIALLGADRRPVPAPPGGLVEALIDHLEMPDPASRLLVQVAALSAARRGGLRPNAPVSTLHPAPSDSRPMCPQAITERLGALLAEWPDLLEEWLDGVASGGWRLTPDTAVGLLTRLRVNDALRDKTIRLAGPLAAWLFELFPAQFRASTPPRPKNTGAQPDADAPVLLPPDIAELLTIRMPDLFAAELARRLQAGALANRNRASLQLLIRGLEQGFLGPVAEALERAATNPNTMGLALSLSDLTRFRMHMIQEFDH